MSRRVMYLSSSGSVLQSSLTYLTAWKVEENLFYANWKVPIIASSSLIMCAIARDSTSFRVTKAIEIGL